MKSDELPTVKLIPGFDPKIPLAGGPGSLESKVKIIHHVPEGVVVPTPQEILDAHAAKRAGTKEIHKKAVVQITAVYGAFGGKIGEPVVALVPQAGDIVNGEVIQ